MKKRLLQVLFIAFFAIGMSSIGYASNSTAQDADCQLECADYIQLAALRIATNILSGNFIGSFVQDYEESAGENGALFGHSVSVEVFMEDGSSSGKVTVSFQADENLQEQQGGIGSRAGGIMWFIQDVWVGGSDLPVSVSVSHRHPNGWIYEGTLFVVNSEPLGGNRYFLTFKGVLVRTNRQW